MEEFVCKFCGRICKNRHSLNSHQVYCKSNPDHIVSSGHRWTKEERSKIKMWHKGKIAIHKDNEKLYILPTYLEQYINDGWIMGLPEEEREQRKEKLKGKNTGRAKDEEAEKIRRQKISSRMVGNRNWEKNKKRGNGKKGRYKGIYCDSSWELAYLVFHIENNMQIKRSTLRLPFVWEGKMHIYIPDFETDEGIIEIKGRKTKKSEEKQRQYPNINVIDIDGIKPYLEYITEKYGTNFTEVLYD